MAGRQQSSMGAHCWPGAGESTIREIRAATSRISLSGIVALRRAQLRRKCWRRPFEMPIIMRAWGIALWLMSRSANLIASVFSPALVANKT